ncbi:MAG TPA: HlyD family secretion protein [Pseudomonadales bacterium]|nr:HlyD family secretion protein [Pseudomonadales bacterium]
MNANLGQTLQLEASAPKKPSLMKKPIVRAALTIALLGALIFFGQWIYHRSTHVYEIDARLRSTLYIVSSELPGRLESFPLDEGMTVNEGQMVAKLDSTRAELLLSELSLELQKLDAQIEEMETSKQVLQHQLESRMQSAGANVDAAGASVKEAELSKKQAEDELRRTVSLAAQKLVSQRQLEQAQTAAKQAAENLNVVRAKATSSSAALSESRANAAQVDVLEKQIQRLRVNRESIQVQRERQASEVKKHTITSPVTGVVDQTFVNEGEYVAPGQRFALVHDSRDVWINANIKETEVQKIRQGQPVIITVDAYPGRTFSGKVLLVGSAATSQFALIPSPNPSGNFTKITQRIPVKISVEQQDDLLKPGMMVEVDIDVSNR